MENRKVILPGGNVFLCRTRHTGKTVRQGVRQERQLFLLRLAGAGASSLGPKLFRFFFSEPAFSGKVLLFPSGLGFQPVLQKQRKRLGLFSFAAQNPDGRQIFALRGRKVFGRKSISYS